MFGVRSECNILEAVYENDVFKYKFYDIYNPTINPAQKIYVKNVYSSVLSLHLKKLDEIVKHKKGFNEIKNIGIILYDLLIPEGLVQFILQIKGSLNILSEEQEIPWELLHDGEDFFGIKYNIGRTIAWNSDVKMNKYVQNGEKTCLIISNPSKDLDYASEESLNLLKLFRKNGVKCRYLGCGTSADKILNVLSNNKYDFIHYSGHITKKNDEYVFVLNNDEFFSINMIKNLDIGNPLVYLNGCISAKIDKLNHHNNINRNFEGAVLPFILAGALGVIGSLWEITDIGSKNFSEIFYNNLINGYSIGESLKKSRFLNLDNNSKDYVWASFIYYGHPGLHYNFGGSCYITKELTNLVDPRISYNVTLSQDINWNNFNDQIIDLLNCAAKIAQDSKVITSVHLIYAFSESYPILFDELCEKYNVYRNKFKVKLDRAIKKHEKKMENNFKKTIDLSQNINYEIRKLDNLKK